MLATGVCEMRVELPDPGSFCYKPHLFLPGSSMQRIYGYMDLAFEKMQSDHFGVSKLVVG